MSTICHSNSDDVVGRQFTRGADRSVGLTAPWCICIGVAGGLWCYTVLRAWNLSFVCDEVGTFSEQVWRSYWKILTYEFAIGNHHLLNTLLMKVCHQLFGCHPFVLRLPNVIAHAVFLVTTLLIMRDGFRQWSSRVVVFCVLNLNPYVIDFFSLGRGYGLGVASVGVGLYGLQRWTQTGRPRDAWLLFGGAFAAVLSHFTLLNFLAAAVVVYNIGLFSRAGLSRVERKRGPFREWFRENMPVWATGLLLVIFVALPVWKCMHSPRSGEYEGGDTGFWFDTVRSLWLYFLHGVDYGRFTKWIFRMAFALPFITVPASVMLWMVRIGKRRREALSDIPLLVVAMMGVACLSTLVQHHVLGVPFLTRRTALFFSVLYALHVALLFDALAEKLTARAVPALSSVLVALLLGGHFLLTANLTHAPEYQFDAMTHRALKDLRGVAVRSGAKGKARLYVHSLFYPSVSFYLTQSLGDFISEVGTDANGTYDFYYLLEELDQNLIEEKSLKVIRRYELSKAVLACP